MVLKKGASWSGQGFIVTSVKYIFGDFYGKIISKSNDKYGNITECFHYDDDGGDVDV